MKVLPIEDSGRPNRRIFEETNRWDEEPDEVQLHRIRLTLSQIPADLRNILDVGCGRGDIANRLPVHIFAGACDLSLKGLARVKVPRVRALVSQLPFISRSFDLVLCAEVLEHLSSEEMQATLDELCRVAGRYVLLTVPHREDLSRMLARCSDCGEVFHVYGHLRSFGPGVLRALHPRLRLLSQTLTTRRERAIRPWVQKARRRLFGIYETHPHMICPSCGNRDFTLGWLAYVVRKFLGLLNRMSMPGTVEEGWVVTLYAVDGTNR